LPILCTSFLALAALARADEKPPAISAERIKAASRTSRATGSKGAAPARAAKNSPRNTSRANSRRPASSRSASAARTSSPSRSCASSRARNRRSRRQGRNHARHPLRRGFSGTSHTQTELEEFDAEAIFVGHGITAPEFDWDDYKGVDVKGKVVVLFTNEPPSTDPKFFGGKALTYYGRWTFKFEEATRRGPRPASSSTRGDGRLPVLRRPAARRRSAQTRPRQPALAFAGWLSRRRAKSSWPCGRTVDGALKEADTKGFKAFSLGVNLKGNIPTRVEKIVSNNVVGMVEGSDPTLKSETVVFTAHWDHLGVGRAVLGDTIYNGAADNATGCALLLELARAWSAQSPKPKRSAIFLAVTAEEKGLLGSKYYAQHPLVPLGKTALNLNFDMILPLGVPESIVVTGAERTTAWPTVKAAAEKNHLEIEADQRAHLGIFYRSDHFSMARAGVPAFSVAAGMKIKGKPKTSPERRCRSSTTRRTTRRRTRCDPNGTTRASSCWPGSRSMWPATSPTPIACRPGTPGTNSVRRGKKAG
jgi:hypothetical protein